MRHVVAALFLAALCAGMWCAAPPSSANEDPDPRQTKKDRKGATRQIQRNAKAHDKTVRAAASDTIQQLKAYVKALRKGKNIDSLSGVPDTPGLDVSPEQARALLEECLQGISNFHDITARSTQDTVRTSLADPLVVRNADNPSGGAFVGTGGAFDVLVDSLYASWEAASSKIVNAFRKFQAELEKAGVSVSFIDTSPPRIGNPRFGPVFPESSILYSAAESEGGFWSCILRAFEPRGVGPGFQNPSLGWVVDGEVRDGLGYLADATPSNAQAIFFKYADASLVTTGGGLGGGTLQLPLPPPEPGASATTQELAILWEQSDGTADRLFVRQLTVPLSFPPPCDPLENPTREQMITVVELLTSIPRTRIDTYTLEELNEVFNSNLLLARLLTGGQIDALLGVALRAERDAQKLGLLDTTEFPCGAGPNGFTVCANIPMPDPGGDLIVVGVAYADDIALNDNVNLYQYGFVFDQDGNTGNNYQPIPQFAGDYFQDSDKWYAVEYSPSSGWELKVTDARNNNFTPVASAARAVISGNSIVLAVPASEFSVPNPAYRTTSFRHTGDFGQNPPFDWTADYDPEPGQPLRPFPTE